MRSVGVVVVDVVNDDSFELLFVPDKLLRAKALQIRVVKFAVGVISIDYA